GRVMVYREAGAPSPSFPRSTAGMQCRRRSGVAPARTINALKSTAPTTSSSPLNKDEKSAVQMITPSVVKLKPVVRFREFSLGTHTDPSMRELTRPQPGPEQDRILAYL